MGVPRNNRRVWIAVCTGMTQGPGLPREYAPQKSATTIHCLDPFRLPD